MSRVNISLSHSHAEHAIPTVFAAGVVCESDRRMDVLVQRVRLPLADGIRGGEQLHGSGRHKGHEGLLGRGSSRGHRRLQGNRGRRGSVVRAVFAVLLDARSAGFVKLIAEVKQNTHGLVVSWATRFHSVLRCRTRSNENTKNKRQRRVVNRDRYKLPTLIGP